MSVYLQDPDVTIHCGNALDVLRELPSESVHMCCTSPPFYGLRDYGTGSWEGGNPDCDHVKGKARQDNGQRTWDGGEVQSGPLYFTNTCGKCGATRVDQQIGLEPTPDEWVAALVAVFREVRRVLRSDGTLWLEVGSSYVSGDMRPSRARPRPSAPAYGSDDRELRDSPVLDSAYLGLCDGCLADFQNHHDRSGRTLLPHELSGQPDAPTDRGSASLDSEPTDAGAVPPDAQESTTLASWLALRGECSDCASRLASVDQITPGLASPDARRSAHSSAYSDGTTPPAQTSGGHIPDTEPSGLAWEHYTSTLGPKNLLPTPWMLAMALQMDGWILRSEIVWSKCNPMPESVTDRPTTSHSRVFLLSKGPRYYWDAEAIREPGDPFRVKQPDGWDTGEGGHGSFHRNGREKGQTTDEIRSGRNRRSVWTIPTEPYPEAHFATWPTKLVEPMILAGTSERGVCPECGAPWERIVESELVKSPKHGAGSTVRGRGEGTDVNGWAGEAYPRLNRQTTTVGWQPTCSHTIGTGMNYPYPPTGAGRHTVPAVVLDPFGGSGTTAHVARKHGRRSILIELNETYCQLAADRLAQQSLFG